MFTFRLFSLLSGERIERKISFPFELRTATESRERGERARHRGGKPGSSLSFARSTQNVDRQTLLRSLSRREKRKRKTRDVRSDDSTAAPKSLSFLPSNGEEHYVRSTPIRAGSHADNEDRRLGVRQRKERLICSCGQNLKEATAAGKKKREILRMKRCCEINQMTCEEREKKLFSTSFAAVNLTLCALVF